MSRGLTLFTGTAAMISTMMGSGIIMLPQAFASFGYIQGMLLLPIIASLCFISLYGLCYVGAVFETKYKGEKATYYSVTQKQSQLMAFILDFALVLNGVCSCASYLSGVTKFMPILFGFDYGKYNKYFAIIYVIPFLMLSLLEDLTGLKYMSILSLASVIYIAALMLYYFVLVYIVHPKKIIIEMLPFKTEYYKAIGIVIFALSCHQNILQVYSELQRKSIRRITMISFFTIAGGAMIYSIVGMAGYSIIGKSLDGNIIEALSNKNYPIFHFIREETWDKKGILIKIAIAALTCVMVGAYPSQLMGSKTGAISILLKIGFKEWLSNEAAKKKAKRIFACVVAILVSCLTMFDVKYETIVTFAGATATNSLTYIFPTIVYMLVVRKLNIMTGFSALTAIFGICSMFYILTMLFNPSPLIKK